MKEGWVPIGTPENLEKMLEGMTHSIEDRIGWCFLCNSAIPTAANLVSGTSTHNCDPGRSLEERIASAKSKQRSCILAQMDHWYLAAKCKTENCPAILLLRYIGPGSEVADFTFTLENPPVRVHCEVCGEWNTYRVREINPHKMAHPPAAGWKDTV